MLILPVQASIAEIGFVRFYNSIYEFLIPASVQHYL